MGWLDHLRNSVVGLDTAPFIYFIEKHPIYLPILRPFFDAVDSGDIQVVTSTLTLTEVLVMPYRTGNQRLALDYARILLNSRNLTVLPVSDAIAEEAARIRAAHNHRTPDAIQIATALIGNAKAFLTNDFAFQSFPGIEIVLLDRLRSQP